MSSVSRQMGVIDRDFQLNDYSLNLSAYLLEMWTVHRQIKNNNNIKLFLVGVRHFS